MEHPTMALIKIEMNTVVEKRSDHFMTKATFVYLGEGPELNWISIRIQNPRWFVLPYGRTLMSTPPCVEYATTP